MSVATVEHPRVVPLREWCKIVRVKPSLGYELSRHDQIKGIFRVGRQVRINLDEYFAQTKQAS
jgi:hypothetical protein